MRLTCVRCCKFKFASTGKRTAMLALGWTELMLAGAHYWICPTCSPQPRTVADGE